jgi:hypothetical protein
MIASLSWMPSRIALFLRDSSFPNRFLRSSRASGRTSCPVHLHHVVGDQDGLCLPLARSQGFEVKRVVGTQDNSLAINHGVVYGSAAMAARMRVNDFE